MLTVKVMEEVHTPRTTKQGKQYWTQKAYVQLEGEPFPKEIKLMLWPNDDGVIPSPYKVGDYQLAPQSFYVGRFGDIECKPILVQIASKQAKAS